MKIQLKKYGVEGKITKIVNFFFQISKLFKKACSNFCSKLNLNSHNGLKLYPKHTVRTQTQVCHLKIMSFNYLTVYCSQVVTCYLPLQTHLFLELYNV